MLTMKDKRAEIKGILGEELESLRQRIIENHIRAGQPVERLSPVLELMLMATMVHYSAGRHSEFWKPAESRVKCRRVFIR